MVDNTNPTSQFHPYQPADAIPQTGSSSSTGLSGILSRFGIDSNKIGGVLNNTRGGLSNGLNNGIGKVRSTAQTNPGMVLGGLAALVIGAGLMRKRSMGR